VLQDVLDDQYSKVQDAIRSEHESTRNLVAIDEAVTRDSIKLELEKTNMTVEAAHDATRSQVIDSAQKQEDTTKLVVEATQTQIVSKIEDETVLSRFELESTLHAEFEATRHQMESTGSRTLQELGESMREANFRLLDLKAGHVRMQNSNNLRWAPWGLQASQQEALCKDLRRTEQIKLPSAPPEMLSYSLELEDHSNLEASAGSDTHAGSPRSGYIWARNLMRLLGLLMILSFSTEKYRRHIVYA
jgi:hypothetical protein